MGSIFRRELSAYFMSPLAYIFLAVFNFFAGTFFFGTCLAASSSNMSNLFMNMFTILLFLIPILTMKLLSEEKRQKTDQGLITSPVSLTAIVLGKYFAALTVFAAALVTFILYAIIIAGFTPVQWVVVIGNIVGLLLLGLAFISIGLFISSLTESQLIAAIISFVVLMLIFLADSLRYSITNETVKKVLAGISFNSRYVNFTNGVFSIPSALFFISVAAIFNFLTVRVLERRRWA